MAATSWLGILMTLWILYSAYTEEVAHASWYVTRLAPKITFLHMISESKQACFQPTVRQRSFYWSRFSSRGCKQTSECSRSREDLLWLVMFMNYAEYLRYLARVERGWRLIWSLLTKIDLENWLLLAVERWIRFNAILLYSTYGARDCLQCHRDACTTSSGPFLHYRPRVSGGYLPQFPGYRALTITNIYG